MHRGIRIIFFCLIVFLSYCLFVSPVYAAKVRVRKPRAANTGLSYSSASISPSTHSVILNLTNLGSVKKVTYELSYTSWDVPQGAMGTISATGQTSDSRSLYFGTCSHGVCTPHYGLGAKAGLMVCTEMKNGTEWCKLYSIGTKRLQ